MDHREPPNKEALLYALNQIELLNRPAHSKDMPKFFQEWTLVVAVEGQGRLVADGTGFSLKQGTGFLLSPGMAGGLECGARGLRYYQIGFEVIGQSEVGYRRVSLAEAGELVVPGPVDCQPFSKCLLLLETLHQDQASSGEAARLMGHIHFLELLLLLYRQRTTDKHEHTVRSAVEQSIEHLKQHYNEVWTVDRLADIAKIGRSRYTQMFKEITGQFPLDHLNDLRIDRAQQLLLMTNDRLYDIAQTVGYSNEYYFNRRFKGAVGVTPGQYRRTHQENIRVFAPFMEDYLLALGIIPVAQYAHAQWGVQDYLGLHQVPPFEISSGNWESLSRYEPELILLNDGYQRWSLEQCRTVAPLFKVPMMSSEDWRSTLMTVASVFGRTGQVDEIISSYEHKAREARHLLTRSVRDQTVAFLRLSACGITLYGSEDLGYTAGVLHQDLGLEPHPLVQQLARGERRINLPPDLLARLDADHLFITFDKGEGEGRELLQTELWQSLPAVRNNHVYEVDFLSWMNYGVLSHRRKIDDVLRVLA
ncbi:AraC family transcriptional regulator [Bacillus sp. FJAT-27264]|uniref:AraC family transcriptional regulator n=1 Tax=Paenibacillus sp. (strain DSM 101736 / FJAT-27264) TaxID=1850362 RepID=UPI0008080668|nr:AraC family transcriptional regulator [Bacillus sp. FJAT-27264]OBZ14595.1 AraC family transcriptional regulator [Bacillus sp. FJAT-27264]